MREAGFGFSQVDPDYADPADPNTNGNLSGGPEALAMRVAEAKLASIPAEAMPEGTVVLTADTLGVAADGGLIGTPESEEAALAILRRLVGGDHTIVTGVALGRVGGDAEFEAWADTAEVRLGTISEQTLREYVATGAWRGKAGGYNLAERRAAGWPIEVDGDPGTVMGLPMRRLTPRLEAWGVIRHGVAPVEQL